MSSYEFIGEVLRVIVYVTYTFKVIYDAYLCNKKDGETGFNFKQDRQVSDFHQ